MSIDNVKGIRIKQMTEHTASIAVLGFFLLLFWWVFLALWVFFPYRKPLKTLTWQRNILHRIQCCNSDHVLK